MKIVRRLALGILVLVAIAATGFVVWATVRAQKATAPALEVLRDHGVEREAGRLVFRPDAPNGRGLILYPGGLVEPEAYARTAQGVADAGTLVVIPKMPLDLAVLGIGRADGIRADFPEIGSWVIGGHSLGGAMAAAYARNNAELLDGLIMYASYPADNEAFVDFPLPVLTIIASEDPGAPEQEAFFQAVGASAERVVVEGGNHRQFADYPFQPDDGVATISAQEQQDRIVAATIRFLDGLE